jgi:septum formation protein
MTENTLILASQSPRRKTLLTQLGYSFSVQASDIDESIIPLETPCDYVLRLAVEKAKKVFMSLPSRAQKSAVVLGSDTSVVINGVILGKPENLKDCINTLSLLSGQQHQVLTAVAVVSDSKVKTQLVTTKVFFKALTLAEIEAYWQTGEPQDKAGSYAIQGIAGQFVKAISGSYSAVVGLPLYETAELLSQFSLLTLPQNLEPRI